MHLQYLLMRKALKIKASFLCLVWFVIFIHGVIPHMHAHNHEVFCTHSHNHDTQAPLGSIISAFNHEHNQTVCHFNPNLFAKLTLDSSFINTEPETIEISLEEIEVTTDRTELKCNKPPLLIGHGLRAPPLV